jgi:hypothetical protein
VAALAASRQCSSKQILVNLTTGRLGAGGSVVARAATAKLSGFETRLHPARHAREGIEVP